MEYGRKPQGSSGRTQQLPPGNLERVPVLAEIGVLLGLSAFVNASMTAACL